MKQGVAVKRDVTVLARRAHGHAPGGRSARPPATLQTTTDASEQSNTITVATSTGVHLSMVLCDLIWCRVDSGVEFEGSSRSSC